MYPKKLILNFFVTFLAALSLFLGGCTSMRTIPLDTAQPAVHVGDKIRGTTKDGSEFAFQITAMDARTLLGGIKPITYDDIASLQAQRFNAGRTALLVLGVAGGIALAVEIINYQTAAILLANSN